MNDEGKSELQKTVERTRAEVARDVREVSERLTGRGMAKEARMATVHMKERAIEGAKEAMHGIEDAAEAVGKQAKSAGIAVKDELRENPIAYGLIAAGIGWIVFDKLSNGWSREKLDTLPEKASRELRREKELLSGKLEKGASTLAEHPFALGATAFAVGSAIGATVPSVRLRRERQRLSH